MTSKKFTSPKNSLFSSSIFRFTSLHSLINLFHLLMDPTARLGADKVTIKTISHCTTTKKGTTLLKNVAPSPRRWNLEFRQTHMQTLMEESDFLGPFDIVLCLGIAHKLHEPRPFVQWCARSCSDLLLFRAPAERWNGIFKSKFTSSVCDVPETSTLQPITISLTPRAQWRRHPTWA